MTSAADMLRRLIQPISVAALAAALMGCFNSSESVVEIYGSTMGSTYSIKWVADANTPAEQEVKQQLDEMLEDFEEVASTWRPNSLLSRFNAAPAGTCQDMPTSILELVELADTLHEQSEGSFDITLGPLMRLWGFHGDEEPRIPEATAIAAAMERTGQEFLHVSGQQLCKDRALEVDISGIAAGYMVDRVAERLIAMGIESYMVELTGELRADGLKPGGSPWRIAVEEPRDESRVAQLILPLRGHGVSTSGDYRNFFEQEGTRYSHTFDPVSGRPVLQDLAAVTVLHPSAAWADGLSTVLLVKGSEEGWKYALEHDLAALFVIREGDGFVSRSTPRFKALQQGEE
jgi:thiamine biosynthesis lipoprotein